MVYDTNVHLMSQVELFLNFYSSGDVGGLIRCCDVIKDILEKEGVNDLKKNVESWDKQKELEKLKLVKGSIKKILDKADMAYKTIVEAEDGESLFIDVQEIQKDLMESLGVLERDYWDSVRKDILDSVKQDEDGSE